MADHHLQRGIGDDGPPAGLVEQAPALSGRSDGEPPSLLALGLSVEEVEKAMLVEALEKTGGNISEASRLLKITRNTLRYRMAKYNLSQP